MRKFSQDGACRVTHAGWPSGLATPTEFAPQTPRAGGAHGEGLVLRVCKELESTGKEELAPLREGAAGEGEPGATGVSSTAALLSVGRFCPGDGLGWSDLKMHVCWSMCDGRAGIDRVAQTRGLRMDGARGAARSGRVWSRCRDKVPRGCPRLWRRCVGVE